GARTPSGSLALTNPLRGAKLKRVPASKRLEIIYKDRRNAPDISGNLVDGRSQSRSAIWKLLAAVHTVQSRRPLACDDNGDGRGEKWKIWWIAGMALTAATSTALPQEAAAGERVFKRLCPPCHEIGPDAKIKLGPPLNAIDGARPARSKGSTIRRPTNLPASPGTKRLSKNIFARQCKRCLAPEWHSSGSNIADVWAYLKQFGPEGAKK